MKKIKVRVSYDEVNCKRVTLFLLECIIIQKFRPIDEAFVSQLNDFIYRYYENNKELFGYLFNDKVVKTYINEGMDILTLREVATLIVKYRGFNGYINLLDDVGLDIAEKLNDLALLFNEYYEEIMRLYLEEPKPGYRRILH